VLTTTGLIICVCWVSSFSLLSNFAFFIDNLLKQLLSYTLLY